MRRVPNRLCPECDTQSEGVVCPKCGARTFFEAESEPGVDPLLGRVLDQRLEAERFDSTELPVVVRAGLCDNAEATLNPLGMDSNVASRPSSHSACGSCGVTSSTRVSLRRQAQEGQRASETFACRTRLNGGGPFPKIPTSKGPSWKGTV